MSWSEAFLGVIALATLVIALVHVGAVVAAARIARQAQQALSAVQQEIRPLLARAQAVADEASRTAALATVQAEKVDRLISDLSQRVETTAGVVQEAIITPAREGMAVFAAVRATLGALRAMHARPRHGRHAEEEDPLFIG